MDERMRVRRTTASLLGGLLPAALFAQPLADPTRPPPSIEMLVPTIAGEEARLSSILLSPDRKLAVIDGAPVRLGARIGSAKLVEITPTQVVLQEGAARRVLRLHPGVEKKSRAARGDEGGSKP